MFAELFNEWHEGSMLERESDEQHLMGMSKIV